MRLLIVEDDALLGDALATGLRQLGHEVEWAGNGSDAEAALDRSPIDAVVLDLGLPRVDGMVWLGRWRARGLTLPILILTARQGVEQRVAGLDAGADDFLTKPITIDELAARLRALHRRSGAQATWQQGELEYDPIRKTVLWKGERVPLTAAELALVDAFLSNSRRVLSKEYLREKLLDRSGAKVDANSLEVHIHHLRRKIDPDIIRTVRGIGYALGSGESG